MRKIRNLAVFFLSAFTFCLPAKADIMALIPNVPAYYWYHGCTPTATAMVLGYWDLNGYPNLFTAQGNNVYLTANVQDQISSPAHNAKYDPTPDDTNLAVPAFTSIADWEYTSVDPMDFGGTYVTNISSGLVNYAASKGYTFQASLTRSSTSAVWTELTNEVNAGRPMLFEVDSDGDNAPDHVVPAFGYDSNHLLDDGTYGKAYACYTTASEDETPVWEKFQGKAVGNIFGIYEEVKVTASPVPETTTLVLLLTFISCALLIRCRRRVCRALS